MSDPLEVPAGESSVVRVFHLDLAREHVRFLRDEPAAMADILGVGALDTAQADLLRLSDLGPVGLAGYLSEGMGVPETAVAPDTARLKSLNGHVLVLRSGAFDPKGERIAPKPGVSLVARYGEPKTDWRGGTIRTRSARSRKHVGRKGVSPRAARTRARAIGGAIFAVVMLALGLLIWGLLS